MRSQTPDTSRSKRASGPILLAEDDVELRSLLSGLLRADGYDVVEVRNGSELLSYIAASLMYGARYIEPSLILTDVQMPGPSGLEVINALKRTSYRAPLVVMTAFGTDETRRRARELGAAAVLDKPFEMQTLRDLVQNLAPIPPSD